MREITEEERIKNYNLYMLREGRPRVKSILEWRQLVQTWNSRSPPAPPLGKFPDGSA